MRYYILQTWRWERWWQYKGDVHISLEIVGSEYPERIKSLAKKRAQTKLRKENINLSLQEINARTILNTSGFPTKEGAESALKAFRSYLDRLITYEYHFDQYQKILDAECMIENWDQINFCANDIQDQDEELKNDIYEYRSDLWKDGGKYIRFWADYLNVKSTTGLWEYNTEEAFLQKRSLYYKADPKYLCFLIRKHRILEMWIRSETPFLKEGAENEYFALIFAKATVAWLKYKQDPYEDVLPYFRGKNVGWLFQMLTCLTDENWLVFRDPMGELIGRYANDACEEHGITLRMSWKDIWDQVQNPQCLNKTIKEILLP